MLSWLKKKTSKTLSKTEESDHLQGEVASNDYSKSSKKKKGKPEPQLIENTQTSETNVSANKSSKSSKKRSKSSKSKTHNEEHKESTASDKDRDTTEKQDDPEEQEAETTTPSSGDMDEEVENDLCEQEDYQESESDFVGVAEFEENFEEVAAFECLSPTALVEKQTKMVKEVADVLAVTDAVAGNLLRHFKWRQERLIAAYLENPKAVLREIGQEPHKTKKTKKSTLKSSTSGTSSNTALQLHTTKLTGEVECLICGCDYEATECTALHCKHPFCNSCWADYLTMKISEGAVERLNCPGLSCKSIVPDQVVAALVPAPVYDKYVRFITKSFVENNNKCTWCPAPNCGNAITAEMLNAQECNTVCCSCGYTFCFSCHNEAHAPASCDHVRVWAAKSRDDSETTHWLGANTKECPKCRVAVEKNGGCMHMVCRQCTHEWCWLCAKPWKGHNDFYSCNRYEKAQKAAEKLGSKKRNKIQKMEEEREQQRQQLARYLHYYERYLSHDAASKMEKQIKDKAYQKMAELESEHATRTEVQFIERASEVLLLCHTTLKWSYVYAYQLPEEGSQKQLFNYLQQELEKTTEKLAELLEAPSSVMPLKRLEAVDLTALAQTKRNNLLKGVVHDEYAQAASI